jgi:hypothetical protein
MIGPVSMPRKATPRDLLFVSSPDLWDTWPFLPLIRHRSDGELDYGVMYDFTHTSGRTGYQVTVFLENLFLVPDTEEALLQLPKEVFDTFDELLNAGWRVD